MDKENMSQATLNNSLFRSAMMQLLNKRFVTIGVDMRPLMTDVGEQQCLQLTFAEAPDKYIILTRDKPAPAEKTKKIYVLDMDWQGALICIAESEEEAVQKMIDAGQLTRDFFDNNKHRHPLMGYDLDAVVSTKGDV